MALKLRPTGLSSPVDKDLKDYTVHSGEWAMGRIYEERGAREELRWYWSIFGILAKPSDIRTDGRAPTLEAVTREAEEDWGRERWRKGCSRRLISRAARR